MRLDNNQQAFFALVKAGLWETDVRLSQYGDIDFYEVHRLAVEQSVVGLVTAGLEHVKDVRVPKEVVLVYVGNTLQIEEKNRSMNLFLAELIEKLRKADIYAILVKGQGIAQCYERPMWRACGDVDLLLSESNYEKAKTMLLPLALKAEYEDKSLKHYAITVNGGFVVELHGTLHSQVSKRIDRVVDKVQDSIFYDGKVRPWMDGNTQVLLPSPNNDVILVFCHILQHFFGCGIGLRQVCDWCRLLWTYNDSLNFELLETRIRKAAMMKQWKAFSSFAVDTLGMPAVAMPFYSSDSKWSKKAEKILRLLLESGNFGQSRDMSYKKKYPKLVEYLISFWVYSNYSFLQFQIFPKEALRGWGKTIRLGMMNKLKKR